MPSQMDPASYGQPAKKPHPEPELPVGTIVQRTTPEFGTDTFMRMPEELYWGRVEIGGRINELPNGGEGFEIIAVPCIPRQPLLATGPGPGPRPSGWTRHGHPIEGVEQVGPRPIHIARCGGPGMCATCSQDAGIPRHPAFATTPPFKEHTERQATSSFKEQGTGDLTADALRELLEVVPDNAVIEINIDDPDRGQGKAWHFTAKWNQVL